VPQVFVDDPWVQALAARVRRAEHGTRGRISAGWRALCDARTVSDLLEAALRLSSREAAVERCPVDRAQLSWMRTIARRGHAGFGDGLAPIDRRIRGPLPEDERLWMPEECSAGVALIDVVVRLGAVHGSDEVGQTVAVHVHPEVREIRVER